MLRVFQRERDVANIDTTLSGRYRTVILSNLIATSAKFYFRELSCATYKIYPLIVSFTLRISRKFYSPVASGACARSFSVPSANARTSIIRLSISRALKKKGDAPFAIDLHLINKSRAFEHRQKQCITHLGLVPLNKCTRRPRKSAATATTAVAIDALHAHYLPLSNRFDCHGNRTAFFPCPARQ